MKDCAFESVFLRIAARAHRIVVGSGGGVEFQTCTGLFCKRNNSFKTFLYHENLKINSTQTDRVDLNR